MSKEKMGLTVREMSEWKTRRMDNEMENIYLENECTTQCRASIARDPAWASFNEQQRMMVDIAISNGICKATRHTGAQCIKPTPEKGVVYIEALRRFIQWKTIGDDGISLEVSRQVSLSGRKIWRM